MAATLRRTGIHTQIHIHVDTFKDMCLERAHVTHTTMVGFLFKASFFFSSLMLLLLVLLLFFFFFLSHILYILATPPTNTSSKYCLLLYSDTIE